MLKIKSAHLKSAGFQCFKNRRAALNLLSNHNSLVEDVLSAFPDKSYESWVHSEQGIVSLNSRCWSRQNTGNIENHSPALLYLLFYKFSPSRLAQQPLSGGKSLLSILILWTVHSDILQETARPYFHLHKRKTTYLRSCCQMMLEQLWMPQERVHTQRKVESGSSLSLPEVSKNTAPLQVSAVCPLTKVLLTWVCYYQCHAVT